MARNKTAKSTEFDITAARITESIFVARNVQVILDSDIAEMYGVEARVLNQAVKRNIERFPEHFRFQLTEQEWEDQKGHIGFPKTAGSLRSQSVISSHGGRRYLPYAFTEQGVAMLSAVLRSETAIQVSIRIMEAFVEMRRFFLQNATLFQKIEQVETRQLKHIADSDEKFNRVFNALEKQAQTPPNRGIFFNGQIFDAYRFASGLIRSAKREIILIDNYIDDSVLTLLSKRKQDVAATVFTRKATKALQLDLEKHNAQYPAIRLELLPGFHDRFILIDAKELYHLGASLKDLGKQCFAFSRMDDLLPAILKQLP